MKRKEIRKKYFFKLLRLLEDLKHQYSIDTERKNELISKLQQEKNSIEDKYKTMCQEFKKVEEELEAAMKNVK